MWWWIAGAWVLLSVALVAGHHRLRRLEPQLPADVEEFLICLENRLAALHPTVFWLGLLPGRFTGLLRVHNQETPVELGETFRRWRAFPSDFDATVHRLVSEIEQGGLDRMDDHDFATVATWILPQVRSREWLDTQGRFGDAGLAHRLLTEDLAVIYVVDQGDSMVFVCHAHLRQWRKSEADVFNLAVANLHRLGGAEMENVGELSEPMILQTGDGYDASRVLLLEKSDGLLVAIPDRDVLWLGQEQGQDLGTLMASTQDLNRRAAHPVSPSVYRVRSGKLEPVQGA
jgi:uncharacterized protein YtpQ (UPF0354 family)